MNYRSKQQQKNEAKPKTLIELMNCPFPFIEQASRLELFQFIYMCQKQNKELKQNIEKRFPGKTLKQIKESNQVYQFNKKMASILTQSLEKINIEITDKQIVLEKLKQQNNQLEHESIALQKEMTKIHDILIEKERQKRILQIKYTMEKKRNQNFDASQILKKLYVDVKQTLQSP